MYDLTIDFHKLKYLLIFLLCATICLFSIPVVSGITTSASVSVKLPIIMYHHLSENSKKLNKYTISPSQFKDDLDYIKSNGFTTVNIADLIDFCENKKSLPPKPIMITFDDGYMSVFEYAYPLLKQYDMKAVINIIGKYTDIYSECDDHNINYSHITWDELKAMQQSGVFEIQNHTYDMHLNGIRNGIAKKPSESDEAYQQALFEDLNSLQTKIAQKLSVTPTAFAYPFGKIEKKALSIIKKVGLKAVFCCWEKTNYLTGNSEELYHLNRFNRPAEISTKTFFSKLQ